MKILYKKVAENEEFQELRNNEKIDLNSNILKIICEKQIFSLKIDDEVIINKNKSKEMVYYKYRTTTKNSIKITAKIGNKDKKLIENKIINLIEDTVVYSSKELEIIKELGIGAIKRIVERENSENIDIISRLVENLKIDIEKLEKIYEVLKNIVKYSKNIIQNPKVELIRFESVKKSNEVKKITANSARFFTMHPEHWYLEGDLNPKPLEILTEDFDENIDIYENRVIRLILERSYEISAKIVADLKTYVGNLKSIKIREEAENAIGDNHIDLSIRKRELEIAKKMLKKFSIIYREVKNIIYGMKNIKLDKKMRLC